MSCLFVAFQIIDRLPLTVESLRASKLGKLVVKLVKDPPSPGELTRPSSIQVNMCLHAQLLLSERELRSPQALYYVLLPFCLDFARSNRIDVSNVLSCFFWGRSTNRSHQGHGLEYRTPMASACQRW